MKELPPKTILLFLSLLFITSCAQRGDHYNLYIDPTFNAEQQNAIINAANSWTNYDSGQLHRNITFSVSIGNNNCPDALGIIGGGEWHSICVIPSTIKINSSYNYNKIGTNLGITSFVDAFDGGTVRLAMDGISSVAIYDADAYDYILQRVAAHEIGHGMGLVHLKEENTLMNAYYNNSAAYPTALDIQQLDDL